MVMVWVKGVIGGLAVLVGAIWILQGINVLGGSMMSGHPGYAVLGAVVGAIGLVLLWSAWRSWSRLPRPGTRQS